MATRPHRWHGDVHGTAPGPGSQPRQRMLAVFVLGLAALALFSPLFASDVPSLVGVALLATALLEALHGLRRADDAARRAAWTGSGISAAIALLLLAAPYLAGAALVVLIAGWFLVDSARYVVLAFQQRANPRAFARCLLAAVGNLLVALVVWALRGQALAWPVAVAGSLRIAGVAWNLATIPELTATDAGDTVVADLGLLDSEAPRATGERLEAEERARVSIDRAWVWSFIATLLAIHLGRMGFDRTALGITAPAVAVLGDLVFALIFAFAIIVPLRMSVRRVTRGLERRAWRWLGDEPAGGRESSTRRLARLWLESRLRFGIRLRRSAYSLREAVMRGLQVGLPLAAIVAATVPVWGMSWYFDTENWAAGMWNSWAESRTDTWRAAMVRAVVDAGAARLDGSGFSVAPPGLQADFSFIVIGDTGEGDASQHVLRDQLWQAAAQDAVRFVVISSDVVYPTGAMKDYETRFWLPFKGVSKPIYAIPGNHDWYDALEAFVVTFFDPTAARIAVRARIEADKRITSTTDDTIARWLAQVRAYRRDYNVQTGFQQAPFFQLQTDRFALIAVDTGVLKSVDEEQMAWLRAALEAARGKTIMAVLGHPFYAGGANVANGNEPFEQLRDLLRRHEVRIVMAGDTHDLEYYLEDHGGAEPTRHFVNGGGGAYMSFGTALAWPVTPATGQWAYYPSTAAVTRKIQAETPWWKRPAWWWTTGFGAWPFSAEWLSAAFDYNVAPFFQSFVEVRVEASANRVRVLPWGVHGRLTWGDLQVARGVLPPGASPETPVEWVVPMVPAP